MVVLLIGVLLLSLLVIEIDTRVPGASMRWGALAKASIWYDDEWRMYIQVLFYRKTIGLARIKSKPVNKKPPAAKKKSKKRTTKRFLTQIWRVLKTFRVTAFTLAIDTGDHVCNAQLFPLHVFPATRKHVFINFTGDNFLILKMNNRPWKILYAFFK